MNAGGPRRTLTPGNVVKTVSAVLSSAPVLLAAMVKPKIAPALREKVVLGVTSITKCGYCQWGHTHWAMAHGVPLEEINAILANESESLRAADPAEAAAILFARQYAESPDSLDPRAIEGLREHHGDAEVAELLAYVRAITLGSLTGNTADAFLDRFRGASRLRREDRGNVAFEAVVAIAAAPVLAVLAVLARLDRRLLPLRTRR